MSGFAFYSLNMFLFNSAFGLKTTATCGEEAHSLLHANRSSFGTLVCVIMDTQVLKEICFILFTYNAVEDNKKKK